MFCFSVIQTRFTVAPLTTQHAVLPMSSETDGKHTPDCSSLHWGVARLFSGYKDQMWVRLAEVEEQLLSVAVAADEL